MAVIDELLVGLGFDYDPEDLEQFQKDLEDTTGLVKNIAGVLVAGSAALFGFSLATSSATDETGKLADETGMLVGKVDALQHALVIAGGDAGGMVNSLRQLSIRAAEAARGVGSGVEAFGMLGISVTDVNGNLKDTDQLLLEASAKMQGLDKASQIELADKLGLADSIRLLQMGPAAIQALMDEAKALGVVTDEDKEISAEFVDTLTNVWRVIKQVSRVINRSLAPALTEIGEGFTEWWKANRELIEQNIPKWIEQAVFGFKLLAIAVGAFLALKVANVLASAVVLMKGLSVASLAAAAGMALIPALLVAVAAAFLLLAEDAKVFFEGGDSFIGDMLEKYPQWEKAILNIASAFAAVWDIMSMIIDGWKQIFSFDFSSLNIKDLGGFAKEKLSNLGNNIVNTATGFLPGGNTNNNSSTNINKVEINVSGSGNPEAVAEEVNRQLQQASQDVNSAVAY